MTGVQPRSPPRQRALAIAAARALVQVASAARGNLGLRRGAVVVIVVVVAVFSWWINGSLTPAGGGLDQSWPVGLSLAIARGLAFGKQVVFAYGPLGLVAVPRAVTSGTLVLGLAGAAAIWLALVAVVMRALHRLFSWPVAALIAILGLNIVAAGAVPLVSAGLPLDEIAFGLVAIALTQPPHRARQAARTLALAGGVLAGLALLVKLNEGIAVTAIIAVGLLGGANRRRSLAIGALTLGLTTSLAWLALGQPIAALPDYVRTALSVVRGYVDAMGYNVLGARGQWEVLVVILSAGVLSGAAWLCLTDAPPRRRIALAGCVLLVHYFVAREMFVRYGPGPGRGLALLVAVSLMIPWGRRQLAIGSTITVGLAVAALAGLGTGRIGLGSVFDPFGRESALVSDIEVMTSPDATTALGRTRIQTTDRVPLGMAAALNRHCVNVEPIEISLIFAYPSWRWCPVGVMQSYAAYTTELDNLAAARYAHGRAGPDRVLRELGATIDGRNPTWESPAAMLSLLCHFREFDRRGHWQALARIPDRCGNPRPLGTFHSGGAGALQIPPAPRGSVLVAQVHGLQIDTAERFETLFARAAVRALVVNGAVAYRVAPDTLTDGLILDVPAYADYRAPFKLNLGVRSLEARIGSTITGAGALLRNGKPIAFSVTLVAVPIKPA